MNPKTRPCRARFIIKGSSIRFLAGFLPICHLDVIDQPGFGEGIEMLGGAFNLSLLRRARIDVVVATALGLGYEAHSALALGLLDIGPVGVVAAWRSVDLELAWQLCEDLDLLRMVDLHDEGLLHRRRVVGNVIVEALMEVGLSCVLPDARLEVPGFKALHRVPLVFRELGVLDSLSE